MKNTPFKPLSDPETTTCVGHSQSRRHGRVTKATPNYWTSPAAEVRFTSPTLDRPGCKTPRIS